MRQSEAELLEHLAEQMDWLEASCKRYDEGSTSEAKRLAAICRTLLHSDGALLKQLGLIQLLPYPDLPETFGPKEGDTALGLIAIRLTELGLVYEAALTPPGTTSSFDRWWTRIVISSPKHGTYSRWDIVRMLANKDGGSHVDSSLPASYYAVSRAAGMSISASTEQGPMPLDPGSPFPPAMRTIAHELLGALGSPQPGLPSSPAGFSNVHIETLDEPPNEASDMT